MAQKSPRLGGQRLPRWLQLALLAILAVITVIAVVLAAASVRSECSKRDETNGHARYSDA